MSHSPFVAFFVNVESESSTFIEFQRKYFYGHRITGFSGTKVEAIVSITLTIEA